MFKVYRSTDLWPTTSEFTVRLFDRDGNFLQLTDHELRFPDEREAVSHPVINPRRKVVGRVFGRDIKF